MTFNIYHFVGIYSKEIAKNYPQVHPKIYPKASKNPAVSFSSSFALAAPITTLLAKQYPLVKAKSAKLT